jgi:hypothetical protein
MRRALATAAALAALLAAAAATPASGAVCPTQVAWHTARYKQVATKAPVALGRRLGTGAIVSSCHTLYPGVPVRRSVYAVPGLRPQVALALRAAHPVLFVSNAVPTAAELRVLARLRGR